MEAYKVLSVLIAEDDEDDYFFFCEALMTSGVVASIYHAKHCEQAIESLANLENVPDYIFLDINMPKMNGIACLEKIRGNEKFNNTPVIMLSTSQNPKDIQQS